MYKLSLVDKISFIFVIAGAINWGLKGLFNLDLLEALFGGNFQVVTRVIYILVGVAGINLLFLLIKAKKGKI
jgi:uncharacterized protein